MNLLQSLFRIASGVVTVYTIMCFLRIILTWFTNLGYSPLGRFLSTMCDPYMNLFSRLPLRIGTLDFSPMVSIGLLTLLSSLLDNIARTGRLYIAGIIISIISLVWSVFSSLVGMFLLFLVIRFLVLIITKKSPSYDSFWYALDNALSPFIYKVTKLISKREMEYWKALGASILILFSILIIGGILINLLTNLLVMIPI